MVLTSGMVRDRGEERRAWQEKGFFSFFFFVLNITRLVINYVKMNEELLIGDLFFRAYQMQLSQQNGKISYIIQNIFPTYLVYKYIGRYIYIV